MSEAARERLPSNRSFLRQGDSRVEAQAAVDWRLNLVISVLVGRTVEDVAQEWDIESSLLHRWVRDFLVATAAYLGIDPRRARGSPMVLKELIDPFDTTTTRRA